MSHLTNVFGVVTLSNANFLAVTIYVRVEYKLEASGLRASKTPSNLLLISELTLCSIRDILSSKEFSSIYQKTREHK